MTPLLVGEPFKKHLDLKNLIGFLDIGYGGVMLSQKLACNQMSLADLAAGAHISCLDYLDEIKWSKWSGLKEWYQKLKSRPSFRPLLKDTIPGLRPPRHYADLDF